ncbi:MAG TPA: crossover junction endodeoxyribonuclease RuvC [Nitrospirae bacterium]|nr:crossover junction endodeoxyribonuclease RuvC [Nitrospirota bacterium]
MKIIGVDPGTRVTGYGIISSSGSRYSSLCWGAIKTSSGAPIASRLKQIADGLRALIDEHDPDCMALEESFFAKNAQSALKLGMARGAIMLVAAEAGLPVHEYSPLLIKQAVVGYGRADKNQVKVMVKNILSLKEDPAPLDASDALATAITHANHIPLLGKMTQ